MDMVAFCVGVDIGAEGAEGGSVGIVKRNARERVEYQRRGLLELRVDDEKP